jgi:hypothetical protein
VPTAHEGFRDFPNKLGKQNDRFPISGKRSFFAFGGHMPSLPVTAKRELYDKCIACRYLAQALFEQMSGQMPCLPVTGSSIWISRCPACWDSGQKRFARLYIQMHCLPVMKSGFYCW